MLHLCAIASAADHKFVFEHRSLSEHNIMKITLPLSFLLCLPAMTMADESSSNANAELRRAGQRQFSKFDEDGKTNRRRRVAKAGKTADAKAVKEQPT